MWIFQAPFLIDLDPLECVLSVTPRIGVDMTVKLSAAVSHLKADRGHLAIAQTSDPSLVKCIEAVNHTKFAPNSGVDYFLEQSLLMH